VWLRALLLGLTTKALLKVNFYTFSIGTDKRSIGPELLLNYFEPDLLRQIVWDEDQARKRFIRASPAAQLQLNVIQDVIRQNIPKNLSQAERAAFDVELTTARRPEEALQVFLGFAGPTTFSRVFP
jgi:hypothetical protein